jgi:hypothetical protein
MLIVNQLPNLSLATFKPRACRSSLRDLGAVDPPLAHTGEVKVDSAARSAVKGSRSSSLAQQKAREGHGKQNYQRYQEAPQECTRMVSDLMPAGVVSKVVYGIDAGSGDAGAGVHPAAVHAHMQPARSHAEAGAVQAKIKVHAGRDA